MDQIRPEDYAYDDEGEPAEEYVADRFRWLPSPGLDQPLPTKKGPKTRWQKIVHQRAYLAAFAETGNKKLACGAAGVTRQAAWLWEREEGPDGDEFRRLLALATEQAVETLEAEARRRAVHGVRKIKRTFFKGELVDERVEIDYSDTLLIFLLKGAAPDKYADRAKVDHRFDQAIKEEAKRMADAYGLDADALIREAEAIVKAAAS